MIARLNSPSIVRRILFVFCLVCLCSNTSMSEVIYGKGNHLSNKRVYEDKDSSNARTYAIKPSTHSIEKRSFSAGHESSPDNFHGRIVAHQSHHIRESLDPNTDPMTTIVGAMTETETIRYANDLKTSVVWLAATGLAAMAFAVYKGPAASYEFMSGYLLEQCLSIDNLFVFIVLFKYFNIPKANQEKILTYGLWGAVLMRGLFIGLGYMLLQKFHSIIVLFAIPLILSSIKIVFAKESNEDETDIHNNGIVQFTKRFLKVTNNMDGDRFFITENGQRFATPLLLCLVCIELTDVMFALDSVPAIFGITNDASIVFLSNIFAIGSLRSVYGILSTAMTQLEYLEKTIGLILGLIGVKMILQAFHIEFLTPLRSLVLVMSTLAVGIIASLLKNKTQAASSATLKSDKV